GADPPFPVPPAAGLGFRSAGPPDPLWRVLDVGRLSRARARADASSRGAWRTLPGILQRLNKRSAKPSERVRWSDQTSAPDRRMTLGLYSRYENRDSPSPKMFSGTQSASPAGSGPGSRRPVVVVQGDLLNRSDIVWR